MSQTHSATRPPMASFKENYGVWNVTFARPQFCWTCGILDLRNSAINEHFCKHGLRILPSERAMLAATGGCPAAKAGTGIVPEWTLKRSPRSVTTGNALPGIELDNVPVPGSYQGTHGVGAGKGNGGEGEIGSDPRKMRAALRKMYKLHFPINENDERWERLVESRTQPESGASLRPTDGPPPRAGGPSARPATSSPMEALVEELTQQPIAGSSQGAGPKRRARPVTKAPGGRSKPKPPPSEVASQEDLAGIPTPSSLYRLVLAKPGVVIEVVEEEFPEEHRVEVANRGVEGQERYYCRFGFAVPQTGQAQWMHDREPCHPPGFSRQEYTRHFYQCHLGLGRGGTRVDQLRDALSRCTDPHPRRRKRSATEVDGDDEPGPSRKRKHRED